MTTNLDWLELVNAIKWQVLTVACMIVLYKPITELTTRLIRLHVTRKEWILKGTFGAPANGHPRSEKLRALVSHIEATGADVEKMAIECLLQLYVNNPDHWSEKLAIGDFVARHCLVKPKAVLLDTGTTVAAVAAQIMAKASWPDLVITNSVLTAVFISVTKSIHTRSVPKVYCPPGFVHAEYCGTYLLRRDLPDMEERRLKSLLDNLQEVPACLTRGGGTIYGIVAATYFSRRGPGANSEWNRQWKRDTCQLANHIIFCVDISKLANHGNGIFEEEEWERILETKDVRIIVAGAPSSAMRAEAHAELEVLTQMQKKFPRLVVCRGEEKQNAWEFASHEGVKRLPWRTPPRQADVKSATMQAEAESSSD